MAKRQFDAFAALNSISGYAPPVKKPVKPVKKQEKKPVKKVTAKKKPAPKLSGPWNAPDELDKLGAGAPKVPVKGYKLKTSIPEPVRKFAKGYMQEATIGRKFDDPYEEYGNLFGNFPGTGLGKAAPIAIGMVGKGGLSGSKALKKLMRQGVKKTATVINKEPWQLTSKELLKKFKAESPINGAEFDVKTYHINQIKKAIESGQTIPKKVLSEYPGIAKKTTPVKIPKTPSALPPVVNEKDLRLINSFKNSDMPEDFTQTLTGTYTPRQNTELWETAKARAQNDPAGAYTEALTGSSDDAVAVGYALINKHLADGDKAGAGQLAMQMAENAMQSGRQVQAYSLLSRLTPEGALRYAGSHVTRATEAKKPVIQKEAAKIKQAIGEATEGTSAAKAAGNISRTARKPSAKKIKEEITSAEKLAKRVIGHVSPPRTSAASEDKLMVDELFKIAKDSLPVKEKKAGTAAIEKLRQIMVKGEDGTTTYNDARKIVLEKFKNNEPVLEAIEAYERSKATPPIHGSTIKKALADEIKAGGETIKDVVLQSIRNQQTSRAAIREAMVAKGFSPEAAREVATLVDKELIEQMTSKKTQLLQQMVKSRNPRAKQTLLDKVNKLSNLGALDESDYLDLARAKLGIPHLSSVDSERISKLAQTVQDLPGGYERDKAVALLLKEIGQLVPSTAGKKISALQAIDQLLNLKTAARNITGNVLLGVGENAAQAIGTPLDALISLKTGKRTTGIPSLGTQIKAGGSGLKQGTIEAWQGINTAHGAGKYDVSNAPVFKGGLLGTAEKVLGVILRGPDRAGYAAAYTDELRILKKLNKADVVTSEMREQAEYTALYRTLQDENLSGKLFAGLKDKLNLGKDWGAGDVVMKYARTAGTLLNRTIDFSPMGFFKVVFEGIWRPLIRKEFDQKRFVMSLSRSLAGTGGLTGTGYILGKLGIITDAPDKDADVRGLQKTTGQGAYQINVSALRRFIASGFDPEAAKIKDDDRLVSYDWAQPLAASISMGANIANADASQSNLDVFATSALSGVDTLAEQPLVQNLRRTMGGEYKRPSEAVMGLLKQIPASFTPTLLNQTRQVLDNTSRNTYSPDPLIESLNMVKNKTPGLAQSLPEKRTIFGDVQENYQGGGNSPFNVLFNPSFSTKYKPTKEASEVIRLEEATGETKQIPRVAPKKIKKNDETIELTGKEIALYQEHTGKRAKALLGVLVKHPEYQQLSEEEKVGLIQSQLTKINASAKAEILADRTTPDTIKVSFKKYLTEYQTKGGSEKTLKKRLESLHPLSGMKEDEAVAYIKTLDKEQVQQLKEALAFYDKSVNPIVSLIEN